VKLNIPDWIKTALKISISLGALYFVFRQIDFKSVTNLYSQSYLPYLIIALFLFVLSKTLAALRLNRFLNRIEVLLSEWENIRYYLLGMFYNLFLPGGIGGDGYKIYLFSRRFKVKAGRVFWAILTDRLSGVLALFCLANLLSLFIDPEIAFNYKPFIWLLVPSGIVTFYFFIRRFFPSFGPVFPTTTLFSFGVQVLQTFSALFILLAIDGSGNTLSYLFIFLLSSIVAMLPISIGGIGTRELTFLYGARLLGLDQNLSVAMSLMFYLITAFVSFWGILGVGGPQGTKGD
jgi:hypothetical protein